MKKIININLSGRVIPIEDSAYEKLQAYIESLRRYFSNEEGRDEIINDIESRIAELMNEKVHKGAPCIVDADVNEIIASMGTPADFDADAREHTETTGSSSAKQQTAYTSTEKKAKSRLYRDANDKFIGGVCSGIAAYMNVDPAIVRILFAIITFGGFGLGFLIYILLWIVLPPQDLEGYRGKRLYRNPEDKVIGGVAGGLAAYLNREARIIRLIFAAPILLSILFSIVKGFTWNFDHSIFSNILFGSISSTFALVYIVLWMVLPEANSTYEKMEMRGEKVDVNSIRQNVREGMDNMKERVKGWSEEVKESAQNIGAKAKDFANTRGKAFATEVGETARRSRGGIGHAIGVLFKAFFIFIFGTIAFSLIVALIALVFGGVAWWPINNFLWTSNWQQIYAWGTLIFFLFVPLIGFITWLTRRLLRVKSRSSYLGWTFGFLWTVGWISAALLGASISRDFRRDESLVTPLTLSQSKMNKMTVLVSQPEIEYNGSYSWLNDDNDGGGWDLSDDTLKLSTVDFAIYKSTDDEFHVNVVRKSFGSSTKEAEQRASKIEYAVISKDSSIDLANGYAIDKSSKFRMQRVQVEIYIPAGKKIRFDGTVREKLNGLKVDWRGGRNSSRNDRRYSRNSFYFKSNTDYIMEDNGELRDATTGAATVESEENNDGDYRYDRPAKDQKKGDTINRNGTNDNTKPLKVDSTDTKPQTNTDTKSEITEEAEVVAVNKTTSGMSLVAWF